MYLLHKHLISIVTKVVVTPATIRLLQPELNKVDSPIVRDKCGI